MSSFGHHHHLISHCGNRLKHGTLPWRGVFRDRMSDHDGGNPQPTDDVHDFISVDAAVDAVFMLDDRNLALVQQLRTLSHRNC